MEHMPDDAWQAITGAMNAFFRQYSLAVLPPGIETDLFAGLR
jgi:hypothetical protein